MTILSLCDDHYWYEIEKIFSRIDRVPANTSLNSYRLSNNHSDQNTANDKTQTGGNVLVTAERWQLALLLEKCLWRQGIGTVTASNRDEIMQWVSTNQIDLIILDLDLLGDTTLSIVREIRRCHVQLPILILTRFDELGDRAMELINNMGDILPLPFTTDELIERVNLWL